MGNNKKISEYEIGEIQEELKDLEENDIEAYYLIVNLVKKLTQIS